MDARRVAIDKLPEVVLLEIFDAYRQLFVLSPNYEDSWNSAHGWFKLTHVCRHWRRVVHLSPSRLHVYLLFTPLRSSGASTLRSLPSLPILLDYCAERWTEKEESLARMAIFRRSRVRGIIFRKLCRNSNMNKIIRVLSHSYPELEILRIYSNQSHVCELNFPSTFLSGSVLNLRRLTVQEVSPRCLSPLLSSATGLVELDLTLGFSSTLFPIDSLIASLQVMSSLRCFELRLKHLDCTTIGDGSRPPTALPKLKRFVFIGHTYYLEALAARLATPSLQHLDADIFGLYEVPTEALHIPHFCRFICNTKNQFIRVHLDFSHIKLKIIAETCIHTHFLNIATHKLTGVSLEEICNSLRLSGPLSTVEEVIVRDVARGQWHRDPRPFQSWCRAFDYFPRLKLIRVPSPFALEVAHSFQLDGQESTVGVVLPALEHVQVDVFRNDEGVSICDAFEPLIAARKQAGCPIMLSLTMIT
jgi:hypothetical protein